MRNEPLACAGAPGAFGDGQETLTCPIPRIDIEAIGNQVLQKRFFPLAAASISQCGVTRSMPQIFTVRSFQ